jgi:hypothetical protein
LNLTRIPWRGRHEEREAGGSRVFTDHVRALAAGGPLDSRRFEAMRVALRAALRSELKKRGLWDSPPSYLGVYGGESWAPADAPAAHDSALEELLAECYSYVFVSRLRSLEAQLKLKPNIDGLVFLNIRHFLHERQKEHDPIGFQIFEVLQSAVRVAVEEGELRVLSGDEKVRNDTVLGFAEGMAAPGRGRGELPSLVARWNDGLLPDLVTSRGRGQEEVVRRLRERLPDLRREGIATFRFKDLVDPMKADVRARWAALLDLAFGESAPQKEGLEDGTVVRFVEPDCGVEERELFHKLVDCVLTSLKRLEVDGKTRGYLAVLWQFLRIQASEGMEKSVVSRLGHALKAETEIADEERPSLRKLAEQLHIPRERLPALYKTLGDLLERCRAANSGKTAVTLLKGKSTHEGKA